MGWKNPSMARKNPIDTSSGMNEVASPSVPGELTSLQETAWLEVVGKMEEVYSDLVHYEVELEEKNAALEEAQRFIGSVLSSMSDLLIVCDQQDRILQVNAAVCELTGRPEDELMGLALTDLLAAPDGETLPPQAGSVCESEACLRTKDGLSDLLSLSCTQRRNRKGRSTGKVITGRPVGELKRAYAALEVAHKELQQSHAHILQAEKMASLGRLVAGVAHELNNPISFVYANVHTLQDYAPRLQQYVNYLQENAKLAPDDPVRKELRMDRLLDDLAPLCSGALEGAERVRDIVRGLRQLSFPGQEDNRVFDLRETIESAISWVRRGERQQADFEVNLPEPLFVLGRSSQLHQVVLNIFQNALDAMQSCAQPRVRISGHVSKGEVRVDICDEGEGIAEGDFPKLFEPFFTTKELGEGTGLGLWVSYDLMQSHGGELKARNRETGGSCFTLVLPFAGNAS